MHNHLDSHFIFEGSNLQFIEKGSLSGGDLITFSDNFEIGKDFNLSLENLGGNTKVTEETSLSGIKAGGTGGDSDIFGGDGSDLGGGLSDLGVENLLEVDELTVGEDEGGVSSKLFDDEIKVRLVNPIAITSAV